MTKQKVVSLAVASALLVGVAGAVTYRTFTATERPDFNIVMDGELQNLKDDNGNKINPVVINGSTYLPLKATAKLFDKSVSWDANTSTVTLGEKISVERSLFDVSKVVRENGAGIIKGKQSLTFDIGEIGVSYETATKITSNQGKLEVSLNDNYSELSLTLLSPENDVTFIIKDKDTGISLLNKTVKKGEICELKEIDIKNVKNLEFSVFATEWSWSDDNNWYFLNPIVK